MLSKELKKRISELNRKDIKVFPLSETERSKNKPSKSEPNEDNQLEKALNGEVINNKYGCFLRILKKLAELIGNSESFTSKYNFIFKTGGYSGNLDELHTDLQKFFNVDCADVLFVDLETMDLPELGVVDTDCLILCFDHKESPFSVHC